MSSGYVFWFLGEQDASRQWSRLKTSLVTWKSKLQRMTARTTQLCHFEALPLVLYRSEMEYDFSWVVQSCTDIIGQIELGDSSRAAAGTAPLLYSDGKPLWHTDDSINMHRVRVVVQPGSVFEFSALSTSVHGIELQSEPFVVPAVPAWTDQHSSPTSVCIGWVGDSAGNSAVFGELVSNLLQPELWAADDSQPLCSHGRGLDLFVHVGHITSSTSFRDVQHGLLEPLEQGGFAQTTPLLFTGGTPLSKTNSERRSSHLRHQESRSYNSTFADQLLSHGDSAPCITSKAGSALIVSVPRLDKAPEAVDCARIKLQEAAPHTFSFKILVLPFPPDREFSSIPTAGWLDEETRLQHEFVQLAVHANVDVIIGAGSAIYQRTEVASAHELPLLLVSGGGGAELESMTLEHRVHENAGFVVSHAKHHAIISDIQRQTTESNHCFRDTMRWVVRADDMSILDSFEIVQDSPKGCLELTKASSAGGGTKEKSSIQPPKYQAKLSAKSQPPAPVPKVDENTKSRSRIKEAALLRKRMKRRRQRKNRKL